MQNNIPKLPNDIIFYILKLKRLKEGERIQKCIKNSNKSLIEYCEDIADEKHPVYKIAFNYCIDFIYKEDREAKYILYDIYKERYERWIVWQEDKPKKLKCPNWCKWKQKTDKEKHQIRLYKCFEKLFMDIVSESGWGYKDSHYKLPKVYRVGFDKYYGYKTKIEREEEEGFI